jgi:hypothetical protein
VGQAGAAPVTVDIKPGGSTGGGPGAALQGQGAYHPGPPIREYLDWRSLYGYFVTLTVVVAM